MRHSRLIIIAIALLFLSPLYANGGITGKVVDVSTGQPVSGVTISTGGQRVVTDNMGRYRLEELAEGDYLLHTASPRFLNRVIAARVADGVDTELEIKIQARTTKLEGFVYDEDGRPVIGVEVYTYPEIDETKTDEKGYFAFDKKRVLDENRRPVGEEPIPSGEFTVFAQKLQYTKAEAKINIITGLRNIVKKLTINKIGVPTSTEGDEKGLETPNTFDDPTQGSGEVKLD